MKRIVHLLAALAATTQLAGAAINIVENFDTNPFSPAGPWSFAGDASQTSRFVYDGMAAPAYTGDSIGELTVFLDSSQPTIRLERSLGATLTQATSFSLTARFSFAITSAPSDQFMSISFGLVNQATTGFDRTGSNFDFMSDDVFDSVEVSYFPNVSPFGGPNLTPTIFGGQVPDGDAFANVAADFESTANLGDNTTGIKELPQGATLQFTLDYTAASRVFTLTTQRVEADGSLTLLDTENAPIDLDMPPGFSSYDTARPFSVDALSIMAYRDGFTTASDPSLIAELTFQQITLSSPVPEPASALLLALGFASLSWKRRRRA